ncbi:PQQ-binding-like beta-propeller repeat protein [Chloroflexi bacterium TSY]|nr:PQQ-binding-like beta-propeller repeat protein [Chloroflexi bacterium TSY]
MPLFERSVRLPTPEESSVPTNSPTPTEDTPPNDATPTATAIPTEDSLPSKTPTTTTSTTPTVSPTVGTPRPTPGDVNLINAWAMAGANPELTSWTPEEVLGNLKPVWHKPFESYISQKVQVIAAYEMLFIATSHGLYALNASDGAERWIYPTEFPLGHSPTVHDGVVYFGGFDRRIHAVDAFTGEGLWTYEATAGFHTNPVLAENKVFAGNRDGYFYAVHAEGTKAGQLAWKYRTDGPILYSAAYRDGVVFFASNDSHAYALNAANGDLIWKSKKLPGAGFRSWWPVIYRDRVILSGSFNYRLFRPAIKVGFLIQKKRMSIQIMLSIQNAHLWELKVKNQEIG